MSALDLCRWSQNGAWLLGYVDFQPLHSASGMSLLRRGTGPACPPAPTTMPRPGCRTTPWSLALPRDALCGSGVWPPLLLAPPTPHQPLSLSRETCRLLAGLRNLLVFPRLGKTPLHVRTPSSAVEHACTGADRLGE